MSLDFNASFEGCDRTGWRFKSGKVNSSEEVLNLRSSLRGRTVPDSANPGLSPLARASVLPGQGLCLGRSNRPVGSADNYGSASSRLLFCRTACGLGKDRAPGC